MKLPRRQVQREDGGRDLRAVLARRLGDDVVAAALELSAGETAPVAAEFKRAVLDLAFDAAGQVQVRGRLRARRPERPAVHRDTQRRPALRVLRGLELHGLPEQERLSGKRDDLGVADPDLAHEIEKRRARRRCWSRARGRRTGRRLGQDVPAQDRRQVRAKGELSQRRHGDAPEERDDRAPDALAPELRSGDALAVFEREGFDVDPRPQPPAADEEPTLRQIGVESLHTAPCGPRGHRGARRARALDGPGRSRGVAPVQEIDLQLELSFFDGRGDRVHGRRTGSDRRCVLSQSRPRPGDEERSDEDPAARHPSPHHPTGLPLFCSSSHFCSGAK